MRSSIWRMVSVRNRTADRRNNHEAPQRSLLGGVRLGDVGPAQTSAGGTDLTGDGAADLVVGSPYSDEDGVEAGLVHILSL